MASKRSNIQIPRLKKNTTLSSSNDNYGILMLPNWTPSVRISGTGQLCQCLTLSQKRSDLLLAIQTRLTSFVPRLNNLQQHPKLVVDSMVEGNHQSKEATGFYQLVGLQILCRLFPCCGAKLVWLSFGPHNALNTNS